MALSKHYTLTKLRSLVRDLADEVAPNKIQDDTIKEIINKNTLDIAEQLNGASAPDYGTTVTISDAASSYSATVIQSAGYTFSTRTIAKTSHGYTAADIGKRIVFWDASADPIAKIAIAEIESITDENNFVVTSSNNSTNITAPSCDFVVFSAHSASNCSLTGLKIDKIIKVVDAVNGLVAEKKDLAFENLANIDMYDNSVFYNLFGETIYLFKGSSVSAWGELTLYYYRLPTLLSADGDYVDLRDKYVPLLIDKCYLDVYARGKEAPPQNLIGRVEAATANIRNTNLQKEATLKDRKGS